MKVAYKKAIMLSTVLGACSIKTIGSDLFLPIIKAKASLSGATKNYNEIHKSIFEELGIELNFDGSIKAGVQISLINEATKNIEKLNKDEIEVSDLKLLSEDNIKSLINENPKLTTNDLELIYELMMKE